VLEEMTPSALPERASRKENSPTWKRPRPTANGTMFT
jgi:hypothetical protein